MPNKKNVSMMREMGTITQDIVKKINALKELGDDPKRDNLSYEAQLSFAKLLKYYECAFATEKKGFSTEISEEQKEKLDREAAELAGKEEVAVLFDGSNLDRTYDVLVDKDRGVIRSPAEFVIALEPNGKLRFATSKQRQQQEQYRAKLLAGFLDGTTDKSFTGTLKSWFVGNSSEYKNAIKALKGYAGGTVDKKEAIDKITKYLDIRKNKVRDHQYGRDRFQGFMEGLQTLMEPAEFKAYCDEVGMARNKRDKSYDPAQIKPEEYAPSSKTSVLGRLLSVDAAEKARAKQTAIEEERQRKLTEQKKQKEQEEIEKAEKWEKQAAGYWAKKKEEAALRKQREGSGPENVQTDQTKTTQQDQSLSLG